MGGWPQEEVRTQWVERGIEMCCQRASNNCVLQIWVLWVLVTKVAERSSFDQSLDRLAFSPAPRRFVFLAQRMRVFSNKEMHRTLSKSQVFTSHSTLGRGGGERETSEAEEVLCEKFSCLLKSRSQTRLVISFLDSRGGALLICSSPRFNRMFAAFTVRIRKN